MADRVEELSSAFARFPGIGPRQARRFVYYLIERDELFRKQLADKILLLSKQVTRCKDCLRYFQTDGNELCEICAASDRDRSQLMVVEKDADILAVERTDFRGIYFVLGGLIPIADEKTIAHTKLRELIVRVSKDRTIRELILGFPMNPAGDFTDQYVRKIISDENLPPGKIEALHLVSLGRGLSTGTELEYSDPTTIENALRNRA